MKPNVKHTLVTFKICPYCIRVQAILNFKGIEIDVKYIEISNKPDWFLQKSPLGKVPILIVGSEIVLFESNVIMEYLDEMVKPSLMPSDPLQKALDRCKFEYANEVIKTFHQFIFASDQDKFFKQKEQLCKHLQRLDSWLGDTKYFHGNEVTLIDLSFAPIFVSIQLLGQVIPCDFLKKYPKLYEYSKNIVKIPAVQKAKVADYDALVLEGIKKCNTFLYKTSPTLYRAVP